jgi:hypothetical protein
MKYHYSHCFFTYSVKRRADLVFTLLALIALCVRDSLRGQYQVGSLTGAVHLSNGNAGVLRQAQWGQKPHVEQKGKCLLDLDFQYEYRPRKRGLSILLFLRVLSKRCQKSYQRDNWLVAAKSSYRRCFLILRCRLFLSLRRRSRQALDCSPTNR